MVTQKYAYRNDSEQHTADRQTDTSLAWFHAPGEMYRSQAQTPESPFTKAIYASCKKSLFIVLENSFSITSHFISRIDTLMCIILHSCTTIWC